jgi:predicted nucleotidyltransferase
MRWMDESLERIVRAERRRNAEAEARIARRLAEARREAARIAAAMADTDPRVRRVVLFGSVASGKVRTETFDVDLAVEGGDILSLVQIAEQSDFPVDVVDLSTVSPRFRTVVEKRGTVIYERQTADA